MIHKSIQWGEGLTELIRGDIKFLCEAQQVPASLKEAMLKAFLESHCTTVDNYQ